MMNLTQAILHTNTDTIKQVLAYTENINYLDEYGYTPLIQAVITGSLPKVQLLIDHKADVNQKDLTGRTALHWAISNDAEEIVKLLLEHNANVNSYNVASEPVLAKAIMRNNTPIKKMLQQAGANNKFANDYIRAKLLGHSFELIGSVDIVDPNEIFTEVDYEGFYFESSIDLIRYSLNDFKNNFASRSINAWADTIQLISNMLEQSRKLIQFDHYLANDNDKLQATHRFIDQENFILPISQQAHAFSAIKCGNLFAIIDRATDSSPNNYIAIYYINRASRLTVDFIKNIVFEKHNIQEIHDQLKSQLSLQEIAQLPIADQQIGNCSWANIEATIPVVKFMTKYNSSGRHSNQTEVIADSLELFQRWQHWYRQRTLDFMIQDFKSSSPARKASIAAMLAAILFQRCDADNDAHFALAKRLIPIINSKGYEYILNSYKQFYVNDRPTKAGANLTALLQRYNQEES